MVLNCPSCHVKIPEITHFCHECGAQFELDTLPRKVTRRIPAVSAPNNAIAITSSLLNTILLATFSFLNLQSNEKAQFITYLVISVISLILTILNFTNRKSAVFCSSFLTLGLQPPILVLVILELSKNPQVLTSLIPVLIITSYLITTTIAIITACKSIKVISYLPKNEALELIDDNLTSACNACKEESLLSNNFCTGCGQSRLNDYQFSIIDQREKSILKLTLFSVSLTWAVIIVGTLAQKHLILTVILSQIFLFLITMVSISISAQYNNILKMLRTSTKVLKSSGYALIILVTALFLNFTFRDFFFLDTKNYLNSIFFESAIQAYFFVFILCILPGVLEEIAFRGFLQNQLNSIFGTWPAIFTTSVIFGVIHFQGLGIIYIFLFSIGLGWIFNKSQSLILCIVIHSLHNFAVLLMAVM